MSKNPSAIGIAAIDSQATVPLLRKAQAAGIPVIAFDSGVASDIPITSCSTDNLASAALAADKLAEFIGGAGKVAIVSFDQTSQTGIERRDGFVAQIEAAVKALKGEAVPAHIDTGFFWYDAGSIDDPQIAAVLYN